MFDDRLVIEQLKNDSYEAFNALYSEYFNLLYGFVFSLTRSHEETKGIVQDTFIKVWVCRSQINPELSFKAWLYKIAKHQIIDILRKKMSDPLFESYLNCVGEEKLTITQEEDYLDFETFKKHLEQSLKKLSPRQAQVFHLAKEMGYSAKEVADILNVSEQVVYNYLSQALAILRKDLSKYSFVFFMIYIIKTDLCYKTCIFYS